MKPFILYLLLTLCLTNRTPLPQTADVPPGSYAPWQEAYAGFLTSLHTAEYRHGLGELTSPGDDIPSDSYSLYDVDKDGVPELFLKCGTCEADYYTLVYTFRGGQLSALGSFPSGHSSLYTVPGEDGIIIRYGQMGSGSIEKFSLAGGGITGPWETLLTETEEDTRYDGYTDPAELVPGSGPIPYYICTQFRPADSPALVLPIYDYQGREFSTPREETGVRAAIEKVLYENAPLFGVSGDGFYGDAGLTTLEEYLRPGTAYPYGSAPLEIKQIAWADVNGDGQTDCLLRMEQKRETWTDTFCTVLSVEGNKVYAYFFDNVRDAAVEPNGTVTLRFYESSWERASFFKNQCYTVPAPEPSHADGLAWDSYP